MRSQTDLDGDVGSTRIEKPNEEETSEERSQGCARVFETKRWMAHTKEMDTDRLGSVLGPWEEDRRGRFGESLLGNAATMAWLVGIHRTRERLGRWGFVTAIVRDRLLGCEPEGQRDRGSGLPREREKGGEGVWSNGGEVAEGERTEVRVDERVCRVPRRSPRIASRCEAIRKDRRSTCVVGRSQCCYRRGWDGVEPISTHPRRHCCSPHHTKR